MKQKRYNIQQDFEAVYLRARTARRFLSQADPALLTDPAFCKSINYMACRFFAAHRPLFTLNGFEWEDVHNIVQFFGLVFWGINVNVHDKRGRYTIMMRFITQRMNNVVNWISKKFHVHDLQTIPMASFPRAIERRWVYEPTGADGTALWDNYKPTNIDQCKAKLMQYLDILDLQLKATPQGRKSRGKRAQLRSRKQHVQQELKRVQTPKEPAAQRRELSQRLRQQLNNDPQKYAPQLSYYAIIRNVTPELRRVARRLCHKYGINYKEWAQTQIQKQRLTQDDIIF